MKVLYDSQIFSRQIFGGISQYYVNLINSLPADVEGKISLRVSANHYLQFLNPPLKVPGLRHFPERAKLSALINKGGDCKALRKGDFDIFHPTEYGTYHIGLTNRPTVVTVHDMIHEYDGGKWVREEIREDIRKSIGHADRLIAISQSTAKDLVKIYGVDEGKIDVVYHGYESRGGEVLYPSELPEDYLLFVGQRGGYKNFEKFFEAFVRLSRHYPRLHLVCTGKPFTSGERKMIATAGLTGRVHSRFVSGREMKGLYSKAKCFVFPSYYEGFGLPILEGFSAGVPVALSDATCFPEIAGEGGAYFNPHYADSMYETIKHVLDDEEFRKKLKSESAKRLKSFSWDKTARETAAVYRKTLSESANNERNEGK